MYCATLFSNINYQRTNSNEKINYLGIRDVGLRFVALRLTACGLIALRLCGFLCFDSAQHDKGLGSQKFFLSLRSIRQSGGGELY